MKSKIIINNLSSITILTPNYIQWHIHVVTRKKMGEGKTPWQSPWQKPNLLFSFHNRAASIVLTKLDNVHLQPKRESEGGRGQTDERTDKAICKTSDFLRTRNKSFIGVVFPLNAQIPYL